MFIELNDNTTFRQIQEIFSNYYPYLKIEFYNKPHRKYKTSENAYLQYSGETIGQYRKTHLSGLLEIQPWYKAGDVEREFQQRFDLPVQIFRKEKTSWEQTTGMDDFTLKDLNEIGKNSSDEFIVSNYEAVFEESRDETEKLF